MEGPAPAALNGLAMSFRAASTRPEMRGKRFRLPADAMVTVWYFRNSGGRSPLLNRILRFLWAQLRSADGTIVDMVHVAGSRLMQSDGSEILLFLNTRLNYHLYYFNSIASLAPAEHQLAQFLSASVFLAMCTCPSCAVSEYASTQTAR